MMGRTTKASALKTNETGTFDLYLFDAGSSGGEGAASAGAGDGAASVGSARGNAGGDPSKGDAPSAAQAGQVSRANKYRNVQRNAGKAAGEGAKASGIAGRNAKSFGAEDGENASDTAETPEGRSPDAEFESLIRGKYREAFQRRADLIVNRRFGQLKALEENQSAMSPLLDALSARYGLHKADIAGLTAAVQSNLPSQQALARQRGMSTEEFQRVRALELQSAAIRRQQVQNQQAQYQQMRQSQIRAIHQKWRADSAATKAVYPGFDFAAENRNPDFGRLLTAGVPVRHAYEVIHQNEVLHGAMRYTAQKVREKVTSDILARGLRPQENGASGQATQMPGFEYRRLSRAAKTEIERRAMRGERVNPRDYMSYP